MDSQISEWRNHYAKAYWEEGGREEGRIRGRRLAQAPASQETADEERGPEEMTQLGKRIRAEQRLGQGSRRGTATPTVLKNAGGPKVSKTTQKKQK